MSERPVYHFACVQCGRAFKLANPQPRVVCSCGNQTIEPAERQDEKPIPCTHRGDALRALDCNCVGKPKVYQCALHGECLSRDVSHVAAKPYRKCTRCNDRQIFRPGRIGIVHPVFERVGGTETFARQLAKMFGPDFVGVATISAPNGDAPFPVHYGPMAITAMVNAADVILCWGIDSETATLLRGCGRHVVAVHHSSIDSTWNNELFDQSTSYATERAAINPLVATAFECQFMRSPICDFSVDDLPPLPAWFERDYQMRYVLWNHRPVADKGIELAKSIASALPNGWKMLMSVERDTATPPNVIPIGTDISNTAFLAVADVFLATPKFEGFGYSVAEAAIAGVPIVSTPAGNVLWESIAWRMSENDAVGDWVAAICKARYARRAAIRQRAVAAFVEPSRTWWAAWLGERLRNGVKK